MKKIVSLLLVIGFLLTNSLSVQAKEPYMTKTLVSQSGNEFVGTQSAYQPVGILQSVSLQKPEDLYIDQQGKIYIVDSGLKAVIVLNQNGEVITQFGNEIFNTPVGIFVDKEEMIYVADYGREEILKFNSQGELQNQYGRPDSPLFGKTAKFKPQKIAVDKRGNMYVVSEGSTNGIIQLANDGTFLGYYGVNKAENSFFDQLRSLFFPDGGGGFFLKNPPAPTNLAIDQQGLVYSLTQGTATEIIKKLNVAGVNMFQADITDDSVVKGISVDQQGNVFTISQTGEITVYDSYGNLLFIFGGKDDGTSRLGLFQQPTAIAVDADNKLYVTDSEKAQITVFEPTDFGIKVLSGVALSKDGLYDQSREHWLEVLRQNGNFGLAHTEMGKSYYKSTEYSESLAAYEAADDRDGYSNAFWEIRNIWLQENLPTVMTAGIILGVIYFILKFIHRKFKIFQPLQAGFAKLKRQKFISDFLFIGHIIKHPIDTYYEIRKGHKGSVAVATFMYAILTFEFVILNFFTAYLFNSLGNDVSIISVAATFALPLLLFIIMHYLVSTITEGSGSLKTVYIATAYSFAPVMIISIPLMLVSHVLTFNEAFIFDFTLQIMVAWTAVLVFIMIKEVQDYSVGETIKNILLTIFAMVVAVLIAAVTYMLLDQVFAFIYSVIQEVLLRV
ncbi:MAG: YIP1 family protein [Culicoidibacterales bacterium]